MSSCVPEWMGTLSVRTLLSSEETSEMKYGSINSSWIRLSESKRWDARYWLKVLETCESMGIDQATATPEQKKAAITATDQGIVDTVNKAALLRTDAKKLQVQANDLETGLPKPTKGFKGKRTE
jgi:hypothetical protein